MKTLMLTKGRYAMVSDEDYDYLAQWKWTATEQKRKTDKLSRWYAFRGSKNPNTTIQMHREIGRRMGFPQNLGTDHKDGNGLNNQRENLRPCNQTQNNANGRKQPGAVSRFKGVSFHGRDKLWRARLAGKAIGYFKSEQDAAKAYDVAATKQYGEFARINFP